MKKILLLALLCALVACKQPAKMGAVSTQPASQTIPFWAVDPANVTGCASDANTGTSATCGASGVGPLVTYGQIVQRWGERCPSISAITQVKFLSGQSTATDPVHVCAFTTRPSYLEIFATVPVSCTATLSNVTAKNRATGQLLQAQAGACFTGGELMVTNVTHPSVAWTYTNVTGSIYTLSQPADTNNTYVSVDTWANGDTVQVGTPVQVNVRSLGSGGSATAPGSGFSVWVHDITLWAPDGLDDLLITSGGVLYMDEVRVQSGELYAQNSVSTECDNCDFTTGSEIDVAGGFGAEASGGHIWGVHKSGINKFGNSLMGGDIILASGTSGTHYVAGAHVGSVYLASGAVMVVRTDTEMSTNFQGTPTGSAIVWGPGAVQVNGNSKLNYPSPAVNVFLNGALSFDGSVTTGCALDATGDPAIWHCGRNLTPALFDAPISSGGFAGVVVGPHGGRFGVP